MLDMSFVTFQQDRRKTMGIWVDVNLVNGIVEEKLHAGHEHVVLERAGFGWLRSLVKSLVSLMF
jgi:hypothetical protein